jgi:RNA polymerase sigma-70 factor (ECF subfamily)
MLVSISARSIECSIGYTGDRMPSRFDTDPSIDRVLIADVLLGDERARRALYERLAPVLRYAANPAPVDVREDCIQEVWEHLVSGNWRVLQSWNGSGALASYVMAVARNLVVDRLRRMGRAPLPIDELPEGAPQIVDANNPEGTIIDAERAACVQRARTLLSQTHQEVIRLRHEMGLKHREIAERLNTTIGSVGGTLARAERALGDKILELCADHIGGLRNILR